ncbi:hypothetical protein [Acetivibrio sp. MSJd-27]|uniref:hypothetical protein n=1 Tax=Acetivibrio sp. MSJd-27 TaxID=2841523 RepID=UPI001C0FD17D|nr:hypothetical protein [Acetivibrio sp. MSJd-27]MBU5450049.1 hypothetical protein [Acetivibrio sp. MSJd-27]
MIIRQLKPNDFKFILKQLIEKAQQNPLDASFNVNMTVNSTEYCIKIQPEGCNKLAVLQAYQIERDEYGHLHELITDNNILSALLELLLRQRMY